MIASKLASLAQQAGSYDDISVLLVRRNPRLGARKIYWRLLLVVFSIGLTTYLWRSDAALGYFSVIQGVIN